MTIIRIPIITTIIRSRGIDIRSELRCCCCCCQTTTVMMMMMIRQQQQQQQQYQQLYNQRRLLLRSYFNHVRSWIIPNGPITQITSSTTTNATTGGDTWISSNPMFRHRQKMGIAATTTSTQSLSSHNIRRHGCCTTQSYFTKTKTSIRTYNTNTATTPTPVANTTNSNATTTVSSNNNNNNTNNNTTIRISKLIATCMGMSRKDVERHICDGNVTLYGKIIVSPATLVSITELYQHHNIAALSLNNKTVPLLQYKHMILPTTTTATTSSSSSVSSASSSSSTSQVRKDIRVWLVHKMAGELVTDIDPYKRPTVMSRIYKLGTYSKTTKKHEHVKIIGRLDMNTEGLLVVTNCGTYARQMELAKHNIHRTYRVRVHGRTLLPYQINAIRNGRVMIDTIRYPSMTIKYDTPPRKNKTSTNQWITMTCTQGKNRQIRKVLESFRCTVTRLIRTSYGDYNLNTIPKGLVQEVPSHNVIPYNEHNRRGKLLIQQTHTQQQRYSKPTTLTSSALPGTTTTQTTGRKKIRQLHSTTTKSSPPPPQRLRQVAAATPSIRERDDGSTNKIVSTTKPMPVQWIRM